MTFLRAGLIVTAVVWPILFLASSLGLLLSAKFTVAEVIRGWIGHVLNGTSVKLFGHDIELVPDGLITALFESVQFAVVRSSISVDLRVSVKLKHAPHRPFTVDKAAVFDHQILRSAAARAAQNAVGHLLLHLEDVVAAIDDDKLPVRWATSRELTLEFRRVAVLELLRRHLPAAIWAEPCSHLGLRVHISIHLIILTVG